MKRVNALRYAGVCLLVLGLAVSADAAKVRVSGDNAWVVYVNGTKVAEGADWQVPTVSDFTLGQSATVAIYVHDAEPAAAGVGGFLADIVMDDGTTVGTADKRWKGNAGVVLANRKDGWEKPGFDDSKWTALTVMEKFGEGVWGFGAPKMKEVLKNPDCTSNWAWSGPNNAADDVYFRIVLGTPATAVKPSGKMATRWAELKTAK